MNIDTIYPPKQCTKCFVTKPICDFGVQSYAADRLRAECSRCTSRRLFFKRKNNPLQSEQDRKFNLRSHFRMSIDRYAQLLSEQNGVCAICHRPETAIRRGKVKNLAVDHSHELGVNRGLLCSKCNVAIGYFREKVEVLESAIRYLQQHKQ